MLPAETEILLKEKFQVYNNAAKFGECEGRLLVELEVFPVPRLTWEFEVLGRAHHDCPFDFMKDFSPDDFFEGYGLRLEHLLGADVSVNNFGPMKTRRGVAAKALVGDKQVVAHTFRFYLPSLRLQHYILKQEKLNRHIEQSHNGERYFGGHEARYVDVALDNTWSLRLLTRQNALDWLNPRARNRGSYLTTFGYLYQPHYKVTEPETYQFLQEQTFEGAAKRMDALAWMLSFANGGYVSVHYMVAERFELEKGKPLYPRGEVAALTQGFRTSPVEQLGRTWVTSSSNLAGFIGCFTTFERMMLQSYWKETLSFVFIQYFQATRGNPWPVVAISLGAVLERLAFTILVSEETDQVTRENMEYLFTTKLPNDVKGRARAHWRGIDGKILEHRTETAIKLLLERIGLTTTRGFHDTDSVKDFLELRNDAVHPRPLLKGNAERDRHLLKALQWVEEVILWRLGYAGEYTDRSQEWETAIQNRYDLMTRCSSW